MSRLDPLFAPRGVAVVGVSRDPGKLGAVMLRSLASFGAPVADRAALGAVLAKLGALLAANPGVEEIEINPLRITAEGLVALDAVLRTADDCA